MLVTASLLDMPDDTRAALDTEPLCCPTCSGSGAVWLVDGFDDGLGGWAEVAGHATCEECDGDGEVLA